MARNRSRKPSKVARVVAEKEKRRGLIEIGRKLGIALPAGLVVLASLSPGLAGARNAPASAKTSEELGKLRSNGVAVQLLGYAKSGVRLASASDCNGIHGDNHVNKDDPDVTNNGKHTNIHTDNHGDSCR